MDLGVQSLQSTSPVDGENVGSFADSTADNLENPYDNNDGSYCSDQFTGNVTQQVRNVDDVLTSYGVLLKQYSYVNWKDTDDDMVNDSLYKREYLEDCIKHLQGRTSPWQQAAEIMGINRVREWKVGSSISLRVVQIILQAILIIPALLLILTCIPAYLSYKKDRPKEKIISQDWGVHSRLLKDFIKSQHLLIGSDSNIALLRLTLMLMGFDGIDMSHILDGNTPDFPGFVSRNFSKNASELVFKSKLIEESRSRLEELIDRIAIEIKNLLEKQSSEVGGDSQDQEVLKEKAMAMVAALMSLLLKERAKTITPAEKNKLRDQVEKIAEVALVKLNKLKEQELAAKNEAEMNEARKRERMANLEQEKAIRKQVAKNKVAVVKCLNSAYEELSGAWQRKLKDIDTYKEMLVNEKGNDDKTLSDSLVGSIIKKIDEILNPNNDDPLLAIKLFLCGSIADADCLELELLSGRPWMNGWPSELDVRCASNNFRGSIIERKLNKIIDQANTHLEYMRENYPQYMRDNYPQYMEENVIPECNDGDSDDGEVQVF